MIDVSPQYATKTITPCLILYLADRETPAINLSGNVFLSRYADYITFIQFRVGDNGFYLEDNKPYDPQNLKQHLDAFMQRVHTFGLSRPIYVHAYSKMLDIWVVNDLNNINLLVGDSRHLIHELIGDLEPIVRDQYNFASIAINYLWVTYASIDTILSHLAAIDTAMPNSNSSSKDYLFDAVFLSALGDIGWIQAGNKLRLDRDDVLKWAISMIATLQVIDFSISAHCSLRSEWVGDRKYFSLGCSEDINRFQEQPRQSINPILTDVTDLLSERTQKYVVEYVEKSEQIGYGPPPGKPDPKETVSRLNQLMQDKDESKSVDREILAGPDYLNHEPDSDELALLNLDQFAWLTSKLLGLKIDEPKDYDEIGASFKGGFKTDYNPVLFTKRDPSRDDEEKLKKHIEKYGWIPERAGVLHRTLDKDSPINTAQPRSPNAGWWQAIRQRFLTIKDKVYSIRTRNQGPRQDMNENEIDCELLLHSMVRFLHIAQLETIWNESKLAETVFSAEQWEWWRNRINELQSIRPELNLDKKKKKKGLGTFIDNQYKLASSSNPLNTFKQYFEDFANLIEDSFDNPLPDPPTFSLPLFGAGTLFKYSQPELKMAVFDKKFLRHERERSLQQQGFRVYSVRNLPLPHNIIYLYGPWSIDDF